MDLKPFMSNANVWRKHFEDTSKHNRKNNAKFHVIQEGHGFPTSNVVTISPVKQAQQIAKSEMVEINRGGPARKRKYKKSRKTKVNQSKVVSRRGKRLKAKKRKLSHKKRRK